MVRLDELLGTSPGVAVVRQKIGRVLQRASADRRLPNVLLQGETGTGKSFIARAMHVASPRSGGPFVSLNCASLPDSLLEAQLFGHERGAFTDAREARAGLFQAASGGTLFLDEVGLMSEAVQGKLLTAIEDKTVRRLGSTRSEAVDVWVVAASSADLGEAAREGRFRQDLYHRLAVVTVTLPPLRERGDDIALLAAHFLERACRDYDLAPKRLDEGARAALRAYDWPGNLRQLANAMERAALFVDGPVVTREVLDLAGPAPARERARASGLREELGALERERLLDVMQRTEWNLSRAAEFLGMPRNTLRYRLQRLGLRPDAAPGSHAPASPIPAPSSPGPVVPAMRWEPRRLALLRLDLVSTAGHEPLTTTAIDLVADKIEIFGGHVEDRGPSGLVAVFGLEPVEDAPRRAAHAALAVLKETERARAEGQEIAVRQAVHVGRFRVGAGAGATRVDLEAKREAWAVLDGLLGASEPGAVVASRAAGPFLERHFDLVEQADGNGLPAYRVFPASRAPGAVARHLATFVGRRENLDLLEGHLAAALRGHGQVVGIVGEAGIGKSRLLAEFRHRVAGGTVTCLEGACFSYATAVPYLPVLALLRQCCGIGDADPAAAVAAGVRRRLSALGMEVEAAAPYLLQLFGVREGGEPLAVLTSEAIRRRTVEAVLQLLVAASREQPLVLAIEDLHWIDGPSEEIVAALADELPGAPILVVATYRPGHRPPWMERSFATQMALPPLSEEESFTLLRSVRREAMPEPVTRAIVSKADGNPFFLEEMCRAVEGSDGALAAPVPDTIEEVLLARIERLPGPARSVLESAAVLGREFAPRVLEAIWQGDGALDAHVRLLTGLELLYERRGGAGPACVFKHALTQEVTYAGLPPERRRRLHAAAGAALETLFAGRLETVYDALAHHYARSDDAAKAVEYLDRFADRAARADAHEEAVRAWREALVHVERLPEDVRDRRYVDVVLRLPTSLLPLGRIGEIAALLVGARERLERLGDPARSARYHFLLARAYMLSAHDRVAEAAQRAIAEAERCGDEATLGAASGVLAVACALSGQAVLGIACGQRATGLLEQTPERWSLSYAFWALGLCYSQTARFPEALTAAARALEVAGAIGDRTLQASATWLEGIIHAAMGETEVGIARCERAVAHARDALNRAIATGFLGFACLEAGDGPRAIEALERAIPPLREFGFRAFEGWFGAFEADACRLIGHLDRAERLARAALAVATAAGFGVAVGWAQQVLGRIAHTRGDDAEAVTRLEEALGTFTRIESRYESARTHLDLAVASWARGAPAVARRHLEHAHAMFAALGVPRHRERAERLATSRGLALASRA